jgi:hypothetical protein
MRVDALQAAETLDEHVINNHGCAAGALLLSSSQVLLQSLALLRPLYSSQYSLVYLFLLASRWFVK